MNKSSVKKTEINKSAAVRDTGESVRKTTAARKRVKSQTKQSPRDIVRFIGEVDRPFLILVIVLVCFGSVMIFSASYAYAMANFGDSYYFARRQLGWIVGGMLILALTAKLADYNLVKKLTIPFVFVALFFNLIIIVLPMLSVEAKGASRQFSLGPINFQPSELLKLSVVLLIARYASVYQARMKTFKYGILPFGVMILAIAGIMGMQSHLSGMIILVALVLVMMFISGSSKIWLGGLGLLGAGAAAILATQFEHAQNRLKVWLDPFEYMYKEGGIGWQPSHSLYAITSGGFWGVGLGRSNEKQNFLPEPHNDYIFAIVCEELGFVGAVAVIVLFALLIWRGLVIARKASSRFASLMVIGIMMNIALHVVLNIAVVTNTIPSTGITLPFFSYGGTSLWILLFQMGMVLSASRYSYLSK
ncbi:MAG: putative peptidoglycan glycosyltransferase FtsW [Eubacteriales bacterium]|nr:putative peptidoglycan glycosyltransferase FtsW [Eubacteriales bacterium]MDD4476040.1 putative peptidoglycan glycosyltransferase FtsW [Eubacteriales bacterium]